MFRQFSRYSQSIQRPRNFTGVGKDLEIALRETVGRQLGYPVRAATARAEDSGTDRRAFLVWPIGENEFVGRQLGLGVYVRLHDTR